MEYWNRTLNSQTKLEKLIGYMGGRCTDPLTETVTHLVTESVLTKKYEVIHMDFPSQSCDISFQLISFNVNSCFHSGCCDA